ncbi:hypothetical protein UFOVP967_74 [uncultured Caudovirales phage]|uniref:Endonuclease GajA/Old nuclease/RecF-like AAA domain-containing protein n=1 Tax=uncultured Caudovirales phage TaxID=2100421 RepID=A0A6J5MNC5_9CAUD|nr:hypothetical protein UFOVP521_42 [uncultured Caudovirales phage]CAB4167204.1 hypothetical protein UFOVP856_14 [uncultured Caudovirales phage]CAB4174695.1 hypothetical protein UFOVP967_74 [uncultured Caudovirales phage]CAB4180149.1 hypothetical protein UFOVP1036_7 [uncultured Caudovirales phage]CAB4186274.1 hypothetical protein UFOVP1132_60 [uncultured Caudovirales phage]
MIKRIVIENFQSLSSLSLDLGRFTVIVGESDLGKSAIFRAVHTLASNTPGTDYISFGSSTCQISLILEDGSSVSREKESSSSYTLKVPNTSSKKFDKTGVDVPAEVESILGMKPIKFGADSISPNFHRQFDAPFLVSETSSFRARVLGSLSGIDILYRAIAESKRCEQNITKTAKIRKEDLDSFKAKEKTFQYMEGFASSLKTTKSYLEQAEAAKKDLYAIDQFYKSMNTIESNIYDCQEQQKFDKSKLFKAASLLSLANSIYETVYELIDAENTIIRITDKIQDDIIEIGILQLELSIMTEDLDKIEVCETCKRPM